MLYYFLNVLISKFAISFCYPVLWKTLSSFGHPPHPHSVRDPDKLVQVQWRDVRGMEHLLYEERLREWGLFSLEKRLAWGSQHQPPSTYKETIKMTEPGSIQAQQNDTQWS